MQDEGWNQQENHIDIYFLFIELSIIVYYENGLQIKIWINILQIVILYYMKSKRKFWLWIVRFQWRDEKVGKESQQ